MFRLAIAIGLLASVGAIGCTFNGRGVPSVDGGTLDAAADFSSVSPCAGRFATAPACNYVVDGGIGQAGSCADDGGFLLIRHCYPQAPCKKATGYCEPRNPTSKCIDPADCVQGICTYIVTEGNLAEAHCVTTVVDGGTPTGASCAEHRSCRSGLCADNQRCLGYCGDAGVNAVFDYIDDPLTVTTACPIPDGGAADALVPDTGAADALSSDVLNPGSDVGPDQANSPDA